jgi:hypothetical protein
MIPKSGYPSVFFKQLVSFHENGDVALYPMFCSNRRSERREEILDMLEEKDLKKTL